MKLWDFYYDFMERFEGKYELEVYDLNCKTTFTIPYIPREIWNKKVQSFCIDKHILKVRVK